MTIFLTLFILLMFLLLTSMGRFIFQFLIICLIELTALLFSGIIGMIIIGVLLSWILEKKYGNS